MFGKCIMPNYWRWVFFLLGICSKPRNLLIKCATQRDRSRGIQTCSHENGCGHVPSHRNSASGTRPTTSPSSRHPEFRITIRAPANERRLEIQTRGADARARHAPLNSAARPRAGRRPHARARPAAAAHLHHVVAITATRSSPLYKPAATPRSR